MDIGNPAEDTAIENAGPVVNLDIVVIGGGQAGLIAGHHLAAAGRSFVILEAADRIGESWRRRWDSLRLFTPGRFASLPGRRLPVRGYPTRDQMAEYLERYAAHFELPVRTGARVVRVLRSGGRFVVEAHDGSTWVAATVVVASGAFQRVPVPAFAGALDPGIAQLTAADYQRPEQVRPGPVLIVGAANSGTDIALDLAATHRTTISGPHPGQLPADIDTAVSRNLVVPLIFWLRQLRIGRAIRRGEVPDPAARHPAVPLIRNRLADLEAAGIRRVGRITDVREGRPVTADGAELDVSTVIWCTGMVADYSWLPAAATDASGRPKQHLGVSDDVPGLYYLGLAFQSAEDSPTVVGANRDAPHVIRHLLSRLAGMPAPPVERGLHAVGSEPAA